LKIEKITTAGADLQSVPHNIISARITNPCLQNEVYLY